jgi:hypothetical protein
LNRWLTNPTIAGPGMTRPGYAESVSDESRINDHIRPFPFSHGNARNTPLIVLLALNLVLRFWLVLRPLEYTDGLSIPDDAYISLTLARNIAHGLGPSFAGEPTNGFQPLFVLMLVPVFLAASNDAALPVHAASALSSIFDSMTLLVLCKMVARRSRSSLIIYPLALAWILNPVGVRTATNGMETSMACFFLAWGLSILDGNLVGAGAAASRRASFSIGVVIGLGMVARIDNIFLGTSALATMLVVGRDDLRKSCQNALVVAFGAFLIYLPWLAYSFSTTGDLYPVSGKAIRLMSLATVDFSPTFRNWYSLILGAGFDAVARIDKTVLVVAVTTLVALLFVSRGSVRTLRDRFVWLVPAILYALLLFAAYSLYVFGPWFFERYLFPIAVVLFLIFAVIIDSLLERLRRKSYRICAITIIVSLVVTLDLTDPEFGRTFFRTDTTSLGYMNIGMWAKRTFTPGTVIGSTQSGALGYFADSLRIINLDGVVSKSCYESLVRFKSMSYLRERHVQYVVGWYSNFQYLEHQSEGISRRDLSVLKKIEGFQSWGYDWYLAKVGY